jgi:HSP20 family protein
MVYAATPTAPVFGLRREIDRLFEDAFRLGHAGRSGWSPAADVRETDQELIFAVEVPGMEAKNVEATTENGVLTIRGERIDEQNEGEEGRLHLAERNYGSFVRRFQLPHWVDQERIQADVEFGVLTLRVPKAALPEPKQIRVNAGAALGAIPASVTTVQTHPSLGRSENRLASPKKANGSHRSK